MIQKIFAVLVLAALAFVPAVQAVPATGLVGQAQFALHSAPSSVCTSFTGVTTNTGVYQLTLGGDQSGSVEVGTTTLGPTAVTESVMFVAPPIAITTNYLLNAWTIPFQGVTTGNGGFSVELGVAAPAGAGACNYRPVSADVPVLGNGVTASLVPTQGFTINQGESLVLKVTDRPDGLATATSFDFGTGLLSGQPVAGVAPVNVLSSPALPAAYPVPGPASILVMALGALAVLGRVWMARRAI